MENYLQLILDEELPNYSNTLYSRDDEIHKSLIAKQYVHEKFACIELDYSFQSDYVPFLSF